MPPPSPRSRTGAFSTAQARIRAVRSHARLRSFLAPQRQGRFPLTPRARARMPRSAVIGCHTPAAPEPPRTPLLRLAFRGLDTPPTMKTAVCSGGCQRRLSPAAPQGPTHSLRVPGGASCDGPSGGSRSRTPAWPPSAAPFAGLPGAGLRRDRLAPAGSHGCALTVPAACLRKPYPMRHGTPCRRRDRSRASQAPAHGSARRVSRTGTVAGGAFRSGSWVGRRVVRHPHGASLFVGSRRARRLLSSCT